MIKRLLLILAGLLFVVSLPSYAATCTTPVITLAGGVINNDTTTPITVGGSCTVICFTIDGSTPTAPVAGTCSGGTTATYSTAIGVNGTNASTVGALTIKALSTKSGNTNSAVASTAYTMTVANPAHSPNGGSFANDTTDNFTSSTTSTVFCSTLNGSTPDASTSGACSAGTTGASTTVIATGTAVKVLGTKSHYANSAVITSSTFTLTVANPTLSPTSPYTGANTTVNFSSTTTGLTFHYLTNGSTVTCGTGSTGTSASLSSSTAPSAVISTSTIGCKTNYVDSAATAGSFTIQTFVAPTYDNDTGSYAGSVAVTITGTGAKYCTDLVNTCDPSTGTTYSTPVTITTTGTYLRSLSPADATHNVSAVKSALYTITVGSSKRKITVSSGS